jgi:general L-amino acid transport system substrate-binding protein
MFGRWGGVLAIAVVASWSCGHARAGAVLDRVRESGVVHCGAAERPGLAARGADGAWRGLEVDFCRAVAVAVLGPDGRSTFRPDVVESDMRRVTSGTDDVSFLTASEILTDRLAGAVIPGPPVFYEPHAVLVRADAHAARLPELEGSMICAEPGTGPERSVRAYFAAKHIPFRFSPWQETEEMLDAFAVGRCPAIAGELTFLAAFKLSADAAGHASRILPDALAVTPVLATTPRGDAEWSAIVGWTVQTVAAAEPAAGTSALSISGAAIGLPEGWQGRVVAAVGTYADIYRRNLGSDSPLNLSRGVNARWDAGGLMCPAVVQ